MHADKFVAIELAFVFRCCTLPVFFAVDFVPPFGRLVWTDDFDFGTFEAFFVWRCLPRALWVAASSIDDAATFRAVGGGSMSSKTPLGDEASKSPPGDVRNMRRGDPTLRFESMVTRFLEAFLVGEVPVEVPSCPRTLLLSLVGE